MNTVTPTIRMGMRQSDVMATLMPFYPKIKMSKDTLRINAAGVVLTFTLSFLTSIEKM